MVTPVVMSLVTLYNMSAYSTSATLSPCKLEDSASNPTKRTVDQLSYASCRDELEEVMKLVKPQHFLPVHGEYSFLTAHAQLAKDVGIRNTSVIRNGQMLGVHHRRNGNEVSTTGASVKGMQLLGDVKLRMLYNDGNKVCCDTLTPCFWFQSHDVHTHTLLRCFTSFHIWQDNTNDWRCQEMQLTSSVKLCMSHRYTGDDRS